MLRPDLFVHGAVWRFLAVDDVAFDLPPAGDPAWEGLENHVRVLAWRVCRAASLIVAGMAVLGWTTDFVLVAGDPALHDMLTTMRGGALVGALAMFGTFEFAPVARRYPMAIALPFTLALVAFVAYELGRVGGVERQLFDFLMFVVVLTVVAPVPIHVRAGYLVAMISAMALGFFGPYPEHRAHPFAVSTVAFLVSMALMLLVIGHLVFAATCRSYFQGRRIARDAEELKGFNEGLARQVAEKTKELRRLYEDLQRVREDERARLSRELHDELGQQLSAIQYVVAKAKVRASKGAETLPAILEEAASLVKRASETTREIARELRPPLLQEYGFAPACEWMVRETGKRLGIDAVFEGPAGDAPAPPEAVAVAVYRVLQEALTNTGKHAAATHVRVSLQVSHDAVTLAVVDDGRGLPPVGERGNGLGLVGMEQRILGLGGRFSVEPSPGGGTSVRLMVPIASSPVAPESPRA